MRMTCAGALARSALFALMVWLSMTLAARAEPTTLAGASAPIVRVNVVQGDVTIRTWDRPDVQVDGDPGLAIARRTARVPASLPPTLIPPSHLDTPQGAAQLGAESFVVSSVQPGVHDLITVKGNALTPAGPVSVMVPNDASLVFVHVVRGNVDVHNYRGGTFIGFVRTGQLSLDNVGGDAFVQDLRGPVVVNDSNFARLRARTAAGNLVFERCNSRQIEATSVNGSIVYDGGTFEPGLARFDSTRGNVAVGASGPVQLDGRVAARGRVYTAFDGGAQVAGREDQASAVIGDGGPVVTATSGSGNVYLYQGSLRAHGSAGEVWSAPLQTISRPAAATRVETFPQSERIEAPAPRQNVRVNGQVPRPNVRFNAQPPPRNVRINGQAPRQPVFPRLRQRQPPRYARPRAFERR
ncbi:MAG: hypothetical protein ACLPYS_10255 [Vulcanimicrobiaceae bacterium]